MIKLLHKGVLLDPDAHDAPTVTNSVTKTFTNSVDPFEDELGFQLDLRAGRCIYVYTHTCVCVCIHVYTHIHIYMYGGFSIKKNYEQLYVCIYIYIQAVESSGGWH